MPPSSALRKKIAASLFVWLALVAAVQWGRSRMTPPGTASPSARLLARSLGDPSSPLWIVEYMDFQCENCRHAEPLVREAMERRPGAIYFESRFLPLIRTHRLALKSAIYAECAARQGRFWPMSRLLFERQEAWSAAEDPDAVFAAYAREAGADPERLSACVEDPAVKAAVIEEKDRARSLGLTATPSFFVNGKKVVGTQALREELEAYFAGEKAS